MKCPRCLAVCMPTDPMCYSCKAPFARAASGDPHAPGPDGKPPLATRLATAFGLVGGACAFFVTRVYFDAGSDDMNLIARAVATGVGSGLLGGLAYALTAKFTSRESAPAPSFDQALRR